MNELISKMSKFQDIYSALQNWCMQNSIEQPKIISYPLEKISKLYDNFLDKYGSEQKFIVQNQFSNQPIWFENQLILFQWAVLALSFTNQIHLVDFKNSQIQFLSSIFRHKQNYIIDYEIKCMSVKGKQIRNTWKTEQEELLSLVVNKMPEKNKWNQIARQLYRISEGKYFRQGKHCRERWFSYIENRQSDKQWNDQADIQLLQLISVIGKRWGQIANKITKSQSRLGIRKRYKILISGALNKTDRQITQKQAINMVLQQKYEKISTKKIRSDQRITKHQLQRQKSGYPIIQASEQFDGKQQSIKQLKNIFSSNISKQKCEDNDQDKINIEIEESVLKNLDQNKQQRPQTDFLNQMQPFQNMYNMAYIPVQYYSPVFPIIGQNTIQNLNYYGYNPSLKIGQQLFFY